MKDKFTGRAISFDSPLTAGFDIAPSDTEDLSEVTRMLYVGTGGDVAVSLMDHNVVVLSNVGDGRLLPLRVRRVLATGTTANDIVGLV